MSSASDAPTLPMTVVWEQDFGIGNDRLDTQHRHLLDQCNLLAERCLASTGDGVDGAFDRAFTQLVAEVRAHLADESAWLAGRDDADLENHRFECEEFDYLASEVATAGPFRCRWNCSASLRCGALATRAARAT